MDVGGQFDVAGDLVTGFAVPSRDGDRFESGRASAGWQAPQCISRRRARRAGCRTCRRPPRRTCARRTATSPRSPGTSRHFRGALRTDRHGRASTTMRRPVENSLGCTPPQSQRDTYVMPALGWHRPVASSWASSRDDQWGDRHPLRRRLQRRCDNRGRHRRPCRSSRTSARCRCRPARCGLNRSRHLISVASATHAIQTWRRRCLGTVGDRHDDPGRIGIPGSAAISSSPTTSTPGRAAPVSSSLQPACDQSVAAL